MADYTTILKRSQLSNHRPCPRGRPVFRTLMGEPDREYFIYVPDGVRADAMRSSISFAL
jgi:hypothetical protein